MVYERSRIVGIYCCGIVCVLSLVAMVVITVAGRDIPSGVTYISGTAIGILATLINTYSPERFREIPPQGR